MTLTLRRTIWDDGRPSIDPEDYQVINDAKAAGRIYRSTSGPRVLWLWFVYGGPRGGRRHSGSAESLEEAKAAWLYAWRGPA